MMIFEVMVSGARKVKIRFEESACEDWMREAACWRIEKFKQFQRPFDAL